jgi:hypothetical protein
MWDDEELSSEHSSFMVLIRRLRDQHSEEEQARDVRKMRAASLALKIAGQLIRSLTMAVHDLNGEGGITTDTHHDASKFTMKAITKFERSLVVIILFGSNCRTPPVNTHIHTYTHTHTHTHT